MAEKIDLIDAVMVRQKRLLLTDSAMASTLGISEAYWNRIRNGERKAGIKFLSSVLNIYPEFRELVYDYIQNWNDHGNKD